MRHGATALNCGRLVLIGGLRKCGTTYLHDLLVRNAAVRYTAEKELSYWLRRTGEDAQGRDAHWLGERFHGPPVADHLDGSTLSILHPELRGQVEQLFSSLFLIVCLRDPARRAFSAYWHMRSRQRERRPLLEILRGLEGCSSAAALRDAEAAGLRQADSRGEIDTRYFDEGYARRLYGAPYALDPVDPLLMYRYFGESLYSQQLAGHRVDAMVIFERLVAEPERVLGELMASAGLQAAAGKFENTTKDNALEVLPSALARIKHASPALVRHLPESLKRLLRSQFSRYAKLNAGAMEAELYQRMRALLGHEYEYWFNQMPELEQLWTS